MLIWINGVFGVGKTQTAAELARRLPGSAISDPEPVGLGIQRMYPLPLRTDFQETPWWTSVVTEVLADVEQRHPGDIIVPMTVSDRARLEAIVGGLQAAGTEVCHVTLLADEPVVMKRLRRRFDGPRSWAAQQFATRSVAFEHEDFAAHVRTDRESVPAVAEAVAGRAGVRRAPRDPIPARSAVRRLITRVRHIRLP